MAVPSHWTLAPCLAELGFQINETWPRRSALSDGTVADSAHSAASDHYPHLVPALGVGLWVTARDITHDPVNGPNGPALAEILRQSRDPRLKYVISARRIFSNPAYSHAADDWAWRAYDGTDPHLNHVHVSVLDAAVSALRLPWTITATVHHGPGEGDMLYQIVPNGSLAGAPAGTDIRNVYVHTRNGPKAITPDEWASIGNPAPMRVNSWARLVVLCPIDVPDTHPIGIPVGEQALRDLVRQEMSQILENTHLHVDPIV